uniref:Baseplate wedge protein n=1 Tax=Myoviridae sp. ctIty1 TaxID=2827673 RepID=A0A8S5TG43_9CAUD|nr:MAG TPA: Baseplate wedge protein [Myoviridae sp. ctIty1]
MNSAALLIVRLLLLKKGTYPDYPDLGIDIRGRYRFAFEEELITLRQELEEQMTLYLPELLPVEVEVSLYRPKDSLDNKILFSITIRETRFSILYNIAQNTIDGLMSM